MSGQRPVVEIVPLVKLLVNRQQEMKQPDGAFSRQLGICRTMWVATRFGKRQVGFSLLRGVTRAYPDLDGEVLAFLRGDEVHDQ